MKLRLMICAMVASASLFATTADSTSAIYGVMSVQDTASSNLVVGVPWVGFDGNSVSISNLVSAANGDVLYVYQDPNWHAYVFTDGKWVGSATVSSSGVTLDPADQKCVARGVGLLLQRRDKTKPIYLCGRVGDGTASSSIAAGTSGSSVRTLFANGGASDLELNTANVEGVAGDRIIVPLDDGSSIQYEYKDGSWGTYTKQSVTKTVGKRIITVNQDVWTPGCTISAGKGAWYLSVGGNPTINWQ